MELQAAARRDRLAEPFNEIWLPQKRGAQELSGRSLREGTSCWGRVVEDEVGRKQVRRNSSLGISRLTREGAQSLHLY